ncbi:hypothetical protein [Sphingobium yanoikuyae]|uniref:hypothetical protein n=1 Tax=Sphingobium yanoikuyae TaxID=13690 RepID=UPI000846320A|nr:hypothetical protein [Sphingobium yanoikuyae]
MIALVKAIWSGISVRREWLTLLAVAAAGAWLYVQYEQVRRDRDAWSRWASTACAFVDAPIAVDVGAPRRTDACTVRLGALASFERETLAESNRALAAHQAADRARMQGDAARAGADARTAREALAAMEKENDRIDQDRVSGPWFDALNRVAGLRRTPDGAPGAGRDRVAAR